VVPAGDDDVSAGPGQFGRDDPAHSSGTPVTSAIRPHRSMWTSAALMRRFAGRGGNAHRVPRRP
jgi:hypothetical protein